MKARLVILMLAISAGACGSDGPSSPTSPSGNNPTRVLSLSGNLAFGDVQVGQSRTLSFTITNSGTATINIGGMSVSGGLAQHVFANWTSGAIPPGATQTVNVTFEPESAGTFSGMVTVNGDQTSGTNTLPISGNALGGAAGSWEGFYIVERCEGTGSMQDLLCSTNRGIFPAGTPLPIRITLTQVGPANVTGVVAFGQVEGVITGTVTSDGFVTLQGTATSGILSAQISNWSTRIQGNSMTGNISYNVSASGMPGVGILVTRLSGVTRR